MKILEIKEEDREILSWFSKPIMRSAVKYLSRDAVIALLRSIAANWNDAHRGDALMEKLIDGKSLYGRLGPDTLLLQALDEEDPA